MGGSTSKEQECELDISPRASSLVSNGREVAFGCDDVDVFKDTVFTSRPVRLNNQERFELTVDGAAVIRIGLLTEKPIHRNFSQDAVFETEDGIEPGMSTRYMYVNNAGCLCYGPPDAEREFLTNFDAGPLYIYVTVIYGKPVISARYGNGNIQWSSCTESNIGLDVSGFKASCGLISSAECCLVRDNVIPDHTYLLRWKLELSKQNMADRQPEYGFIRVGITSKKQTNLFGLSVDKGNKDIIWCTESAIRDYPYSGTLAVRLNLSKGTVTHNILVKTVDNATTEKLHPGTDRQGPFYMVVEMYHGNMAVVHAPNADVVHTLGSAVYVKNCKEFTNQMDLHFEIARHGREPCKVLYGTDPTSFVVEFHERFLSQDVSQLSRALATDIRLLDETRCIQVLSVPDEVTEFELKSFFSRPQACGGSRILSIKKNNEFSNTWRIVYESADVARKVYSRSQYSVEGHVVSVLPYYQELGHSAKRGDKPVYDIEPFAISTDMMDEDKICFLRMNDCEMNKFKQFVKDQSCSSVELVDISDSDGEEDLEVLWVECEIPRHEFKQLLDWKSRTQSVVVKYFHDEIRTIWIQLDPGKWRNALTLIEQMKHSMPFYYVPCDETKSIKIVSRSSQIITKVTNDIGKPMPNRETSSSKLTGMQAEKFIALDVENKVHNLARKYRGIQFRIDRTRLEVGISGPHIEVDEIKKDLQALMLNVKEVSVQISNERAQMARKFHAELSMEIKKQGINDRVRISNLYITLWTLAENDREVKRKRAIIATCIENIIREESVYIDKKAMIDAKKIIAGDFEQRFDVLARRNNESVTLVGTPANVSKAKKTIQEVVRACMLDLDTKYISKYAAEYLATYGLGGENSGYCTYESRCSEYTGIVFLKGSPENQTSTSIAIDNATKNLNAFRFSVSKPWLASAIETIPVGRVAEKHSCLVSIEISDSLATANISAVSILTGRTVAIYAKQSEVFQTNVDALVCVASPDLTSYSPEAESILREGGPALRSECVQYVEQKGRLKEGDVVITTAGMLPCRSIIHAVMSHRRIEQETLKLAVTILITKVFKLAEREKLCAIAVPVIDFADSNTPVDTTVVYILEAMTKHFEKKGDSAVESVFLCTTSKEGINAIHTTLQKNFNTSPWFTIVHGRSLPSRETRPTSSRLKSGRPRPVNNDGTRHPFGWGLDEAQPTITFRWNGNKEQEGMPFKIDLAAHTKLHVVKGSIDTQQVDVIVNSTTHFPNLTGAVSNAIMRTGGAAIAAECKLYTGGKFHSGQMVSTGAGKLRCKSLYHAIIDSRWTEQTHERVYQLVRTCLEEASHSKYVSIAFPTFGTGLSKYPPDQVADAMIGSVNSFVAQNKMTTLKDVYVVVFYADVETIQSFETTVPVLLFETLSKQQGRTTKDRHRGSKESTTQKPKPKLAYLPPANATEHSEADDVILVRVTHKKTSKESQIMQDFRNLIDDEYITKEISINNDDDEEALSTNEEALLKSLARKHGIQVEIKSRQLILSGLKKAVQKAEVTANDMLLRQFRETRIRRKMAQIVLEHVQWMYEDSDGKLKPVSDESNLDIHMGYVGGEDFVYKNNKHNKDTPTEYKVIVAQLEEHPVNDPGKRRKLCQRNRVAPGIEIPQGWTIQSNNRTEEQVILAPDSPEFTTVKTKFIKGGIRSIKILNITRIENRYMWQQYQSKKRQLETQNPKGTKNERELWHGTDEYTYDVIVHKGYDRSFAGKNATRFGKGSYFATSSLYSHGFARPDNTGTCRMFLNKVLTGVSCVGHPGMSVLPARDVSDNQVICYDSAAEKDMNANPTIFVIFHDTQAYPEYLIEYK